jgi:membrane fusion protein, multidrug efflux system
MRKFPVLFTMALVGGAAALYVSPTARQWSVDKTGVDLVKMAQPHVPKDYWPPDLRGGAPTVATGAADPKAAAAPAKKGPPPAPVTAATVVERDMPVVLSAAGTVEALQSVAVKPRVDGQIIEVGFKEGDMVQEGQIMFRLDERLVKAQIQQAEANIARDTAGLADAETQLGRKEALIAKKIVTEAATDTARTSVLALKASIAAGKAQLEIQKTQLDYLTIKAPLTGRTGALTQKLGSAVRAADPLALVVINQIKPVVASFAMPQTELTALRRALTNKSPAMVNVGGSIPLRVAGELMFVDNQVDKTTGTVIAKVVVPNADEALWPGLAVEVDLTVEVKPKVIAVPSTAVLPSQQGMLAWVVDANDKVTTRQVMVERLIGATAFISEGLKPGERVVTDGQQRLAPNATVKVTMVEPKPVAVLGATTAPAADAKPTEAKPVDAGKPGKSPAAGRGDAKTRG